MIFRELVEQKLLHPPVWVLDNLHMLVMHGSHAYGCNHKDSDIDLVGICLEPKSYIFPNQNGYINNFDKIPVFEQYNESVTIEGRKHDVTIYGLCRYFKLAYECNINVLEVLYVPRGCVVYSTPLGERIRSNRKLFLNKRDIVTRIMGYAYSQLKKLNRDPIGKRKEMVDQFGFDLKFSYNLLRLCYEASMLLSEHDMELDRYREVYKSIRRGEWSEQKIRDTFASEEELINKKKETSTLPDAPQYDQVKNLLLGCIDSHYSNVPVQESVYKKAVNDIQRIVSSL